MEWDEVRRIARQPHRVTQDEGGLLQLSVELADGTRRDVMLLRNSWGGTLERCDMYAPVASEGVDLTAAVLATGDVFGGLCTLEFGLVCLRHTVLLDAAGPEEIGLPLNLLAYSAAALEGRSGGSDS